MARAKPTRKELAMTKNTNTLGQTIGKINHTFGIKNHSGQKTQLTITFDFTTASDADIKQWLVADRTIALQKPSRALSIDELDAMNKTTVLAQHCARKIVSREERIQQFENSGMPHDVAVIAVDNPTLFASIMEKAKTVATDETETETE